MSLSLDELEKVLNSLQKSLELYHQSSDASSEAKRAFRDACIQRFEYCIELSWKVSMKVLGSATLAAKPAIREMARNNLVSNPEVWMGFIEARNETSHSYDEKIAEKVFKAIEAFYPEAVTLLSKLRQII